MGQKILTLSSAVTTSAVAALDWRTDGLTTVAVSANSSSATGGFSLQMADRDIMLNSSAAVVWIPLSSGAFDVSALSTNPDLVTIQTPVPALRIVSSTTISSGVATVVVTQADH